MVDKPFPLDVPLSSREGLGVRDRAMSGIYVNAR